MEMNIEKLIENQVKSELEEMDLKDIIETEVRKEIADGVGKEIVGNVSSVAKFMIAEEVRKALDGEVNTDDGWGRKTKYGSFEELFRSTFKKFMDEKYEVKKEIERLVNERVKSLVAQDYNRVIEKMVDEITKSKLVKQT